jgi:hypothetical protein
VIDLELLIGFAHLENLLEKRECFIFLFIYYIHIVGYGDINRVYYVFALAVHSNEKVNRFAILLVGILAKLCSRKITVAGNAAKYFLGIIGPN